MSVSSNSRKESTESNAAQQMHSTMGIHPALSQLNDTNMVNDLPSRVAESNDTEVPEDVLDTDATAAVADDAQGITDESLRQTDESIPPARPDEPVRTVGNS